MDNSIRNKGKMSSISNFISRYTKSSGNQSTKQIIIEATAFLVSQAVLFYGVKWVLQSLDPNKKKRDETKAKATQIMDRLGLKKLRLNEYEETIATEVIFPEDITVSFEDVGGLDDIIDSIKENVIYPLMYPNVFSKTSSLLSNPKGILLYGPPGCGKTMLAKAIAKESGANFINLHISTLTDKYYGESQKLVNALFSLAQKLEPTIIFIDEIDSFLRDRRSQDHEATAMMKAEFMSLWDGLVSDTNSRIIILGATNRPNDIDQAIIRRMPKRYSVQLPNFTQRVTILKLMLKDAKLDDDLNLEDIANKTNHYSGSDIKELCRAAVMAPVREYIRTIDKDLNEAVIDTNDLRPVKLEDFFPSEKKDDFIKNSEVELD